MDYRIIKFTMLILILIVFVSGTIFSQSRKTTNRVKPKKYSIKLIQDKPSVYINFVRYETFKSTTSDKTNSIILMKIYNNMRWDISLCSYELTKPNYGVVGLHYRVEEDVILREMTSNMTIINEENINKKDTDNKDTDLKSEKQIPLGYPPFDFCKAIKLKSGKSFNFYISPEDIIPNTKIAIEFFFPWEDVYESFIGKEPAHSVYFRHADLPKI